MAARFDVPARLAEGRAAVEHTHTYVSACRVRGYQHPDLTGSGAQVWDWYDSDDGLDLRLLDDDCAQLCAAVDAAGEVLRVQRAQLDELAAAWRGSGADDAAGFLHRHCAAGAALTAGLRAAAAACEVLRDELWRIVDDKVSAVVDIDDRAGAHRPVWLAAARAVTAGGGRQQAAEHVVDRQVNPYVDNDIRSDWVAAMRSARAAVAAAYQAAAAASSPGPGTGFLIPGPLGPRYQPVAVAPPAPAAPAAPAAVAPAAEPVIEPLPAAHDPVAPPLEDPLAGLPADAAGWPGAGDLPGDLGLPAGAGLPTGGGILGSLIPRIADAIGGLLNPPDDGVTDPELDESFDDPPGDDDAEAAGADEGEPTAPDEPGAAEPVAVDGAPAEPADGAAAEAATGEADPVSVDQQSVAPPEPADLQRPEAEQTPCEIAADELPQVGK